MGEKKEAYYWSFDKSEEKNQIMYADHRKLIGILLLVYTTNGI